MSHTFPNNISLPLCGEPAAPRQPLVPQLQQHTMILPVRNGRPQDTRTPTALPFGPTPTPQQSQQAHSTPALAVHAQGNSQLSLPLRQSKAPSKNEVEPRDRLPNRNGEEPATVCFGDHHLRRHEHHHLLDCGHEIYTQTRQPCGGNCALEKGSSVKAPAGKFACPVADCTKKLRAELKRERGLFVGGQTQGLRKCFLGSAAGKGLHEALKIRLAEGKLVRDVELKGIAAPVQSTSARQQAVNKTRERSLSPNVRTRIQQRYRERDALMIVDKPSIQYPQSNAASSREKTLFISGDSDGEEDFEDFAKLYESTEEASATQEIREHMARNYPTVSNRFAFDFSMRPEDLHALAREQGADMNRHESAQLGVPHTEEAEEEVKVKEEFDVQETHCVCESAADGLMVGCTGCQRFFHSVCVTKGQADLRDYNHTNSRKRYRAMREDVKFFSKEMFSCSKCDQKAATSKQTSEAELTVASMREQAKAAGHDKRDSTEIFKFTPQYSVQQRLETYKLWERDESQLAPGERLPAKTRHTLDEIANRKIAEERAKEESRAEALFKKVATVHRNARKTKYACDGCDTGIRGYRWQCTECKEHDLCRDCREDPAITHQHQCGAYDENAMRID